MASRPVFMPDFDSDNLVKEYLFHFSWASGFAEIQKKKNISALHEEAKRHGIDEILEISSKSNEEIGKRLSAFSLKLKINDIYFPLESVYQGSKVFEGGGPFTNIFEFSPKESKRFIRSLDLGNIIGFELEDNKYPLFPKNAFYDWLYIRSLADHSDWIAEKIQFKAFTDIEFNPAKQVNCQARAFAEYLSLIKKSKLDCAVESYDAFAEMLPQI